MGSLPVRMQLDLRSPRTTNDARSSPEAPRHSWGAGYGGNCHLSQHLKTLKNMQTHQPISSFIAVSQDSPVFGKELKVAGGHEISPKQTGDPFWSYRGKTTWVFSQLPLTAVSTPRIPGRVHIFSNIDHLRKFSNTSTQRCRPVSMGWDKFRQEGSDWWPWLVLFDVFLTKRHWRNSSPQNLKTQEMQIYFREDVLNLSVSFSKKTCDFHQLYLPKVRGGLLLLSSSAARPGMFINDLKRSHQPKRAAPRLSKISWGKECTHAKN